MPEHGKLQEFPLESRHSLSFNDFALPLCQSKHILLLHSSGRAEAKFWENAQIWSLNVFTQQSWAQLVQLSYQWNTDKE